MSYSCISSYIIFPQFIQFKYTFILIIIGRTISNMTKSFKYFTKYF
nr:MAG TPA: hypothetical protein [Crassvirales sp.]